MTRQIATLLLAIAPISSVAQEERIGGLVKELSRRLADEVAAYDDRAPLLQAHHDSLRDEFEESLRQARMEPQGPGEALKARVLGIWGRANQADREMTIFRRRTIGKVVPLARRLLDELLAASRDSPARRREEFAQLQNAALIVEGLRSRLPPEEQAVATAVEKSLVEQFRVHDERFTGGPVVARLRRTIRELEGQYARLLKDEDRLDTERRLIQVRALGAVSRITAGHLDDSLTGSALAGPADGDATDRIAERFNEYSSVVDEPDDLTGRGSRAVRPSDIDRLDLERLRDGRFEDY